MNRLALFSGLIILSTLISSFSQIMLKISAGKIYSSRLKEYLNPWVITAYILFFGCTFLTMYALKVVPLSMAPVLESSGYIFITILSRVFLREKITGKKLLGLFIILTGILIYSL